VSLIPQQLMQSTGLLSVALLCADDFRVSAELLEEHIRWVLSTAHVVSLTSWRTNL
jgi:hypothetical protein